MSTGPEQFVSKVHPASRPVEREDPMTLHATPVSGDPAVMLRCVVQEYAWMGWDTEAILRLFGDPGYPALGALRDLYGEASLREQVQSCLAKMGVFRVASTIQPEPASSEEPAVFDISIPPHLKKTNSTDGMAGAEHRDAPVSDPAAPINPPASPTKLPSRPKGTSHAHGL